MTKTLKALLCSALAVLLVFGSVATFGAATASAPKLKSLSNSTKGITVKWSSVKSATAYEVFSKVGNGSYKKLAKVSATKYTHTAVKATKRYAYKVRAVVNGKKSKFSPAKALIRVTAPKKIAVKNVSTGVKISWTAVKGATKYVVVAKKSTAKSFSAIYRGTKTAYIDSNLSPGSVYDIKVRAYTKTSAGAFSGITTHQFLESPELNAEEKLDMKGITLEWTQTKGAVGYIVYRSLKTESNYKRLIKIANPYVNATGRVEYKDMDVTGINSYKYYVVAYNGTTKSARSNVDYDVYGHYDGDEVPLYLTISKGEVYRDIYEKLNAYGVVSEITWSSTDTKIVKVNALGIITGVSKGKATLIATGTYKGKAHKIRIITTVK